MPKVGKEVHYVALGSANGLFPSVCRAAIVTEVGVNRAAGLCVFNPTGIFLHPLALAGGVQYHEGIPVAEGPNAVGAFCDGGERRYPGGTWHYPEEATA